DLVRILLQLGQQLLVTFDRLVVRTRFADEGEERCSREREDDECKQRKITIHHGSPCWSIVGRRCVDGHYSSGCQGGSGFDPSLVAVQSIDANLRRELAQLQLPASGLPPL